jgi:hypothetical protein
LSASPEYLPRNAEMGAMPALSDAEIDRVERRLDRLATTLDSAWGLPGTRFRFGADAVLGLLPGVGDAASFGLSAYLVYEARRLGAPPALLRRMVVNVGLDSVVGAVPLLGDVFDVVFKANKRNMALLRGHLAEVRSRRLKVVNPR